MYNALTDCPVPCITCVCKGNENVWVYFSNSLWVFQVRHCRRKWTATMPACGCDARTTVVIWWSCCCMKNVLNNWRRTYWSVSSVWVKKINQLKDYLFKAGANGAERAAPETPSWKPNNLRPLLGLPSPPPRKFFLNAGFVSLVSFWNDFRFGSWVDRLTTQGQSLGEKGSYADQQIHSMPLWTGTHESGHGLL